jgi:hypothetical protein
MSSVIAAKAARPSLAHLAAANENTRTDQLLLSSFLPYELNVVEQVDSVVIAEYSVCHFFVKATELADSAF